MLNKENKEYAQIISDIELKYAPFSFKDEHGIIIPKTEAEFNERGYYKIVNIKPSYDEFRYICKFVRWYMNENRIYAEYSIEEKPKPEQTGFEVSKMYLEIAIIKAGLYDQFIQMLDNFEIPLDDTGNIKVKAKFLYDRALVINTQNEMFLQLKPVIAEQLCITEDQIDKILEAARAK